MKELDRLAERKIREHQVKQLKFDERNALEQAQRQQDKTARAARLGDWRQTSINRAGPMGVLDVVAQDLESFVELFEHAPVCELPMTPELRRNVHIS